MKDWLKLTVKKDALLVDVLAILNKRPWIVLVVDESKKLLGTITDGDVRRALISGKTMDCLAEDVMQRNFSSAIKHEFNEFELRELMKEKAISQIPLVNEKGVLSGLRLMEDGVPIRVNSTPVVIMAGGLGTRLRPLTDNCPKPMLKVDGKPMLEIIIESLMQQGFVNFYIAINYLGEQIINYFGDGAKIGVNIQYMHEEKRLGTAGALSLLPELDETLIVLNGDVLTNVDYNGLLSFHKSEKARMSICVREHQTEVPYGVVDLDGSHVKGVTEKPRYNDFVNAGIYAVNPEVLKLLPYAEYKDMPDLVKDLLLDNSKVAAFPLHEYWMDIGRHSEFQQASSNYKSHMKDK